MKLYCIFGKMLPYSVASYITIFSSIATSNVKQFHLPEMNILEQQIQTVDSNIIIQEWSMVDN